MKNSFIVRSFSPEEFARTNYPDVPVKFISMSYAWHIDWTVIGKVSYCPKGFSLHDHEVNHLQIMAIDPLWEQASLYDTTTNEASLWKVHTIYAQYKIGEHEACLQNVVFSCSEELKQSDNAVH